MTAFSWAADYAIDEYRLVITHPDGKKVKMDWVTRNEACPLQTCSFSLSFSGVAGGQYQWHVEGRNASVKGISKSVKRTLTVLG